MANITLHGSGLDIDIADELSQYSWHRPRWSSDKLIAASPFRYDNTPSFYVDLTSGGWSDSGAYDEDYESGNIAKLLAFLRDETYEETCEYLYEVYGVRKVDMGGNVEVKTIELAKEHKRIDVPEDVLTPYLFRHPYLGGRGITDKVQRFMSVGYDKGSHAVTIPWRHPDGTLANVKYRKIQGKAFWYRKGAAPIRSLVYGIDKVYKHDLREVYVCEAEIDAMSCYTIGVPAVAIGGASISDKQIGIITRSPIKRIIIAVDNDKAGGKLRKQIVDRLGKYVEVADIDRIDIGLGKDINDILKSGNGEQIKKTTPVQGAAFRINLG